MNNSGKVKVALTFALYQGDRLIGRQVTAEDIVRVGRDPRGHLRVDDELASRMHAVIEVASPADITLIDLGSEPGTLVNGQRVNKCKIRPLDQIQIGSTRLVLEHAESAAAANPFAESVLATSPYADLPYAGVADVDPDAPSGGYTYAMVRSGPDVNPEEVEVPHLASIEVMILWDTNVLHVDHLTPPRSYFVGEEYGDKTPCDYFVPSETLGTTRAPIVVTRGAIASLIVLPRATGTVEIPGQGTVTLSDLVRSGRARPSSELSGAHEFELPSGAKAKMELESSGLTFQVSAVHAGKPVPAALFSQIDRPGALLFGFSLLLHMGVFASLALFMPHMNSNDSEAIDRDTLLMMQHLLGAQAEREEEQRDSEQVTENHADDRAGGTGARAPGEEGSMGTLITKETGHRYGIKGPEDNPDPHLARERALHEMMAESIIGLLNAGGGGDPNAPTAPWGRDDSRGNDALSAQGNMWGDTIGDAFGAGGFGLSGVGIGAGGRVDGIGLGNDGVFGQGAGLGTGPGFGNSHGHLAGAYVPHVPSIREPKTTVNGRLPPEVIQRIVRQNFGRFRLCYENGLRTNPTLQGRVAVKFVIDRSGSVSTTSDGGSDMPDQGVVSCVVRGFGNLSFPQPEAGIVTVVYPLVFNPAD
jgi:pSer/pThr/pTyr-binding forkhead associated (FHA) protein